VTSRFRADDVYLDDLAGDVLAVCPSCGGCVHAIRTERGRRRAACGGCGWHGVWGPEDEGLPLWLTTDVGGHELWAYNAAHLDLVEAFVGATLRERGDHDPAMPRPLVDKLPGWLKQAKNRDAVLAGVARLRRRLP